jgi:RNA polymerase sigma factor (TIGR02999 family)
MTAGGEITRLLIQLRSGDSSAFDRLLPLVYRDLHKLAKRYMAQENAGHTLQTTAIIHEAYLKLAAGSEQTWQDRVHFFAVAARAMRQILVDHARAKGAAKRGGDVEVVRLEDALSVADVRATSLLALDDAMQLLARLNARQSQVVELRYFGGFSVEETAAILKISTDTVTRDWILAKAFLYREMKVGSPYPYSS